MPTAIHSNEEIESLPILENEGTDIQPHDNVEAEIPITAHRISRDSWFQVTFLQITALNSAYVLGYSGTIMLYLGWIGGVVGFIIVTVLSLDANILIAKLHTVGGKRHIRYRDLAGHFYGRKGYLTLWVLQYVNLFLFNIGYIILAGSALKAFYDLFSDDNAMKLSYCNLIAGFACFIFAVLIPHLSAMKVWLGVSTVLILVYIIVAVMLSVKDGTKAPARDYSISGTLAKRIFTTIGSTANLFVTLNSGMIPEIQATVREPAVGNMIKVLVSQFTVGVVPMYAVAFVGYWAYGSSVSTYLLDSTTGPLWVKAFANISAFFQAVISFHIFASPSYEYFDTKYGIKGSALEIRNLLFRIGIRGGYVFSSSLLSALLPFLGDFMNLSGALCTVPLTIVIPNHMYLVAKKNKLCNLQKLWHWLNFWFFSCFSVIATIAAVRVIVVDSKNFHLFGS